MNNDPYVMIKSGDPVEVRNALIRIRQLAQTGDERAEKHVRGLVVLGCPHELDAAVAWQLQLKKSGDAYALINQDDVDKIKEGIMTMDRLAREGDSEAIKFFKLLHVCKCPTDLDAAARWHIQMRKDLAAHKAKEAAGGCMLIVGLMIPAGLATAAVLRLVS
jgi:hypothetical protein